MKKWIKITIWVCVAAAVVWWFFPRRIVPYGTEVTSVSVESGLTGRGCELESSEEMEPLLETLKHTYTVRTLPRIFAMGGYSYILRLYDADENEVRHMVLYSGGGGSIGAAHVYLVGESDFGKLNDILRSYTNPETS